MLEQEKEGIVYRIMTGEIYIDQYQYKLVPPDTRNRYLASCLYQKIIDENKYEFWLSEKNCLQILIYHGSCSAEIDDNLKKMAESIEDLKVDLYNSYFNTDAANKIRKTLALVRDKQGELVNTRHSLDYLTLSGYAEMIKQQFLIYSNLCHMDGSLVWPTLDIIDVPILEDIMSSIKDILSSSAQLREIARTEPWRSYWNISRNPFDKISSLILTEEQRTLIMLSKMYDSIYEHPKCPPDCIINDDDVLDGWMIKERREREKERNMELTGDTLKHLKEADEVFIPAKNAEDIKRINSLNDTQANAIKKQRNSVIKNKGQVVDAEFADQKMKLQTQANTQFMNKVKGNG